jgi:protein-S-isoprenylcysteine O-methyltransferase Ste14
MRRATLPMIPDSARSERSTGGRGMSNAVRQHAVDRPYTGRERFDWMASTIALAAIYAIFAIVHFQNWMANGHFAGLGTMLQETLVVVLFIVRRRASQTSRSPMVWLATALGAFGVLAFRPGGDPIGGLGSVWAGLQLVAALGYIASLGFLGRSFGVVPAHRGIQTSGPYGWVRHPVYAAYTISNIAYLLENPTLWNLAVFMLQGAGQLLRIRYEEELLSSDPEYRDYQQKVRYRLLPRVY